MKTTRNMKAFTLVELLVTMVVTGILLSAVVTLAFAMSSASRSSDDTSCIEAQLRQTRLRIGELLRTCKLICARAGNDLVIWSGDPNRNNRIDVNEVVYLEYDSLEHLLRLREFVVSPDNNVDVLTALELPPETGVLTELGKTQTKDALIEKYSNPALGCVRQAVMLRECSNVSFVLDPDVPRTRRVTVSFELGETGAAHPYDVSVSLRAWAGNLLSPDGTTLVSDDD
jgi:prepilin-type N-terminal cleavage/methylation domain-containing protein